MMFFTGPESLSELSGAVAGCVGLGFSMAFSFYCSAFLMSAFRKFVSGWK
jgi:hypothetical protein